MVSTNTDWTVGDFEASSAEHVGERAYGEALRVWYVGLGSFKSAGF